MLRRDWRAAADAFGEVGWRYDRALMLSLLDDEEALTEAIEIARELGAEPLAQPRRPAHARARAGVPARPARGDARQPGRPDRAPARGAGAAGRRAQNAEIAERLVVSPRTAEHHVAAVMTKLGATSRHAAVRRAIRAGPRQLLIAIASV